MNETEVIRIGHGSGGRLTRELIDSIFLKHFNNPVLSGMHDASVVNIENNSLAFTTDSYVIDPVFFPGGDIGKLAVSGTVNDLSVSGAIPKYLSCGFIIEEGFPVSDLEKIAASMAAEAENAGVAILAGDTKVVKRGQCDKIFINTSGIGIVPSDRLHISSGHTIQPGDKILVSGTLGDHAITILATREDLTLENNVLSDTASLNQLTELLMSNPKAIRFMRDITRGGLATILCEVCETKNFGIEVNEKSIPVGQSVRAVCELYGFDPLYLANEGKMVLIVDREQEHNILKQLKEHPLGVNAASIGEITGNHPGKAVLNSLIGGRRVIDMLSGEMLPRIC